jgi:AraC family ethanolamine operon transcriptional activator
MLQADGAGLDSEIHRDLVLQHILALLEQASVNEETPVSYGHRKRVVDRVRSYLEDAGDQPVTMTQLCEIACVSRRTLQYSFETILGISPVQYLRRTRLNRVRRRLLLGLDDSVADAAASQGFYHLSQFSLDYKRLFGERPSDTFRASVH